MKKQENGRQSVKESSVKNGKKRVRRNADRYEWFSDENDYFRCCEMTNVYAEPHFHGSWEFIFVAEGRLCALLDGEEYRAEAGDVLFIPGFVVHYIPGEEKNRSFSIVFSDSYKKTFDEEYGKQFDFVLKNQGERSAEIFRLVEACQSRFPSFNACEKHGFADLMLGMLANL
ncbi:MAG: cupin domain-containing protein, partial [Candidatus Scatosoma sp.]